MRISDWSSDVCSSDLKWSFPMSDPVRDPPAYRPNDPYETSGIQAGFQLPRWMWRVMFGCYSIFFVTVAAATGHDTATVMMIVISILNVVMVFGTTGIPNAQKGPEYDSPLDRVGGVLEKIGRAHV